MQSGFPLRLRIPAGIDIFINNLRSHYNWIRTALFLYEVPPLLTLRGTKNILGLGESLKFSCGSFTCQTIVLLMAGRKLKSGICS